MKTSPAPSHGPRDRRRTDGIIEGVEAMTETRDGESMPGAVMRGIEEVAARLREGLVELHGPSGSGAGTIVREDGLIVTSNHVVPGDRTRVVLAGGSSLDGLVVGRDAEHDLAMLQIEARGLSTLVLGDSDRVRVGQFVLAAGHPFGRRGRVTTGIVSSIDGATGENRSPLRDVIHADVRLAPGNSGGPLADSEGRVIGINSMITGGMAVAVRSNLVARLLAEEPARPAFLGIELRPVAVGLEAAGLMVTAVADGSAAARSRLYPGDVVIAVDGETGGVREVVRGLRRMRAGRPVQLRLLRGGSVTEIEAIPDAAA